MIDSIIIAITFGAIVGFLYEKPNELIVAHLRSELIFSLSSTVKRMRDTFNEQRSRKIDYEPKTQTVFLNNLESRFA